MAGLYLNPKLDAQLLGFDVCDTDHFPGPLLPQRLEGVSEGVVDRGCAAIVQVPMQVHPPSFCTLLPALEGGRPADIITGYSSFYVFVGLGQWEVQANEWRGGQGIHSKAHRGPTAILSFHHSFSCPPGLGMMTFPVLIAQDTVLSLISLYPHLQIYKPFAY